jgi:hypothetical protein
MQVGVHELVLLVLGALGFVLLWRLSAKLGEPRRTRSLWHFLSQQLTFVRRFVLSAETVTGQEAEFIDEPSYDLSFVLPWLVRVFLVLVYLLAVSAWLASTMNSGVST